jgi:polygalacturonase
LKKLDQEVLLMERKLLVAALSMLAGGLVVMAPIHSNAQLATGDTRKVSQPTLPSTCTTLFATLQTANRTFGNGDETTPPDTSRIQAALNKCKPASGSVGVVLAAAGSSNAFLTGPLTLPSGVVLVIDKGATLFGSNNPANYQISGKPACGTVQSSDGGCTALITATGANSGVMGTGGTIDGRGDINLVGQSTSWWGVSNTAHSDGKKQNNPRMIQATGANNFTVFDVNLINAPFFHIYYQAGNGLTVWGVNIKTPASTHNTDGIDPDSATNVTINNCNVEDGDDGIAIKTNASATSNITVENSNFFGTHGISIGSQTQFGVTNVLVENNTINGKDSTGITSGDNNGIRIKTNSSAGGKVSQITYTNICMKNVKHALVFNPFYQNKTGSDTVNFTDIVVNGVRSVSSASSAGSIYEGFNSSNPLNLTLENVQLDATSSTASNAKIGLFNTNFTPSGSGVTTSSVSGSGSVPACTSFPTFPTL